MGDAWQGGLRRTRCESAWPLEEGGYEARGLIADDEGYFAISAKYVVVSFVRQLVQQVGRKDHSAIQNFAEKRR